MQKNALILELLNNCRKIHACLTGTERLGKNLDSQNLYHVTDLVYYVKCAV